MTQFVDFSQTPDGAFVFHAADGTSTKPVAGPYAASLAQQVAASRPPVETMTPPAETAGFAAPVPVAAAPRDLGDIDALGARDLGDIDKPPPGPRLATPEEVAAAGGAPRDIDPRLVLAREAAANGPSPAGAPAKAEPGTFAGDAPEPQAGGGAPRFATIKGGERLAGRQTQGTVYRPEDERALDEASLVQRSAAGLVAQEGVNAAEQEAAAGQKFAETVSREDTAAQAAEERQLAEYRKLAGVDENHWWATRSTGQKIAAVIGMALGGFVAGAHGGPNEAARIIEGAIDKDIAAQRERLGKKRAEMADAIGFFDKQRARAIERARTELQTAAASAKLPEARARAAAVMADLEKSQAAERAQRGAVSESRAFQEVPDQTVMVGGGPAPSSDPLAGLSPKEREKLMADAQRYGEKMMEAKIPQLSAAQQAMRALLARYPDGNIPGWGYTADAKDLVPGGRRALMSEEERANRLTIEQALLAYGQAVTGAGGSEETFKRIYNAFKGSGTGKELAASIGNADQQVNALLQAHAGAYDPRAVELYNMRGGLRQHQKVPASLRREDR